MPAAPSRSASWQPGEATTSSRTSPLPVKSCRAVRSNQSVHLLIKIEAAARAQFKTILVPRGQLDTADWDLSQLATRWNIKVIEVATLEEAYQLMTTAGR